MLNTPFDKAEELSLGMILNFIVMLRVKTRKSTLYGLAYDRVQ